MVEFLENSTAPVEASVSWCFTFCCPQEHLTNSQSAHLCQTLSSPFVSNPLMSLKPNPAESSKALQVPQFGSQVCQSVLCKHCNQSLKLHTAFTVTPQLILQGFLPSSAKAPQAKFVSKATKSLKSPIPICKWFDPSKSQQRDASACWAQ